MLLVITCLEGNKGRLVSLKNSTGTSLIKTPKSHSQMMIRLFSKDFLQSKRVPKVMRCYFHCNIRAPVRDCPITD